MRLSNLKYLLLLSIPLHIPDTSATVPGAEQIMQQVNDRARGNNVISQVEMILVEEHGHLRSRKLQIFAREDAEKIQRILFFQKPANIAKTALLVEDFKNNDSWITSGSIFPHYTKVNGSPAKVAEIRLWGQIFLTQT